MQTVSHVTFRDETVCMDDRHFVDCHLLRCVLEYSGKELTIERTEIIGCRLKLNAAAGRTMNFLQCLGYIDSQPAEWTQLPEDGSDDLSLLN